MKIQTLGTYLVLFICLFSLSFASSNEPNYNELIKEINSQEETLIFSNFDNNTAIELGIFMVNKAKKQNKAVTEIRRPALHHSLILCISNVFALITVT